MPPLTSPRARADILSFFTAALVTFSARAATFSVVCTIPDTSAALPAPPPPAPPPARLVVLDSSFNPPTVAHARMVLSATSHYHSPTPAEEGPTGAGGGGGGGGGGSGAGATGQRVLLLLSVKNADKAAQPAAFPQRLSMMYLFAKDLLRSLPAGVSVDVALSSEPYFHDKSTLVARAARYEGAEQVFLLGFDTLIRLFDPRYYAGGATMAASLGPLFERARLRVVLRVGDKWGAEDEQRGYLARLADGGLERVGGRAEWVARIDLVPGEEGNAVSSSAARAAMAAGDEELLGKLLGDGVRAWVANEGLYKGA